MFDKDIQTSIELGVDLMKDIVSAKPVREKILNEMLRPRKEGE